MPGHRVMVCRMSCLSQQTNRGIAMAVGLLLWSTMAWGATLTWDANTESDLAGYRVYQCNQLPCRQDKGTATMLVTLGKVTSFEIGKPAITKYYMITAYDFANNESDPSGVVIYTPSTASRTPSLPQSPWSRAWNQQSPWSNAWNRYNW